MSDTDLTIILTFLIYLIIMLVTGLIAWKYTQSASDYFLGGRSLGPWPAALSAGASDMSGWLLMALPGYTFVSGLESLWIALGLLGGTWLNWLIVAGRLRAFSRAADNALTLPEFFRNRFYDHSGWIQIITAIFILLFFIFYTSSGLVAGGKLFETVFDIDYRWSVAIGTFCIISYTLFGGFLAVSWTDVIQGLLMSAALLFVPIAIIQSETGINHLFSHVSAINPMLLDPFTDISGSPLTSIVILSLLGWGLGYFGQPHILARFAAIRSVKHVPAARRISIIWTSLSLIGAVLTGMAGLVYLSGNPTIILDDPETLFMVLVNTFFHPVIAGILLAAILAAIMSTADSQLLVSSSALAEDLYKTIWRRKASSKEVMVVGRISVLVIACIALLLSMNPDSTVLGLVSYAWAGFGAAFGPVLIISLFWRRMNRTGALTGIITGALTVVIWKHLPDEYGSLFALYEIIPGFLLAFAAVIIASLCSCPPSEKTTQLFDQVVQSIKHPK
ncbi:Osmoregulated proline transporter OpuE [invertebrate metagenome]|uniref:Osmoregulated proline transporter OpuE n=1 Tax=invertebrate metagenome TaxID=1711999 RepID=A0A2H9T7P9_9ZZZZ